MALLFVYGTLMDPEICRSLLGRTPLREPAELAGYERRTVRHASYPAITATAGTTVRGLLLRRISNSELAVLDDYEGDEYERIRVKARVNEIDVEAWAYVWVAGNDRLGPTV
jgi:gamma-glutamylcyclotransferase (GGCT)/AIG2-like uncharacterized protein YtfP